MRQLDGWLVEQLCGLRWAELEQSLSTRREGSFVAAFLAACARLEIGYEPVALSAAQRSLLDRILVRLIDAQRVPITLEMSREPIDEELAESLDEMFNAAYAVLRDEIEMVGETCPFDLDVDIDVGGESERWDRALRAAATQAAMIELVDLLRPLDAGDLLSLADFDTMLADDVIDLLLDWIGKHQPPHHVRNWNRDTVEAAYWLFAKPGVVARLSWRAAVERLLANGFAARAIRYAALRAGSRAGEP